MATKGVFRGSPGPLGEQTSKQLVTGASAGAAEILPRRVTGGSGVGTTAKPVPAKALVSLPLPASRLPFVASSVFLSPPLTLGADLLFQYLLGSKFVCVCMLSHSVVSSGTPWAVACQAPHNMSLTSPPLAGGFSATSATWKALGVYLCLFLALNNCIPDSAWQIKHIQ